MPRKTAARKLASSTYTSASRREHGERAPRRRSICRKCSWFRSLTAHSRGPRGEKMKRSLTILNRMAAMALAACAQSAFAAPLTLGNAPLYLSSSVPPLVMLTVSKDHSLYSKAYNDYSDLDGDGQLETTYKHGIDYAGYFDSYKCYSYDATNNYFYPVNYSAKRRTGADAEPPLGQGGASANNLARKYCNGGVGTVTVSN